MSQACAWLKMMHLKRSIIRPIHTIKGSIKEGLQDTIRGEISLKIMAKVGDSTLGMTSTKIK